MQTSTWTMRMLYHLVRLLAIAALCYAVACIGMLLLQRHMIYIPAAMANQPEAFGLVGVEVVTLDTPDGERLETWTWEGRKENPVIVFFHGNAGNLENRHDTFQMLAMLHSWLLKQQHSMMRHCLLPTSSPHS